jgi:superfamily I DNA and/or RNA helicase
LRTCTLSKNKKYCFEGSDFVCNKLNRFVKDEIGHHKRKIENMKEMKKLGLKRWISQQKEIKFCP